MSADSVTVRFWAAAKAAAGRAELEVPVQGPVTVAEVLAQAQALLPERTGLARVVAVSSFLVGERRADGSEQVPAGGVVEVLPPFAGG